MKVTKAGLELNLSLARNLRFGAKEITFGFPKCLFEKRSHQVKTSFASATASASLRRMFFSSSNCHIFSTRKPTSISVTDRPQNGSDENFRNIFRRNLHLELDPDFSEKKKNLRGRFEFRERANTVRRSKVLITLVGRFVLVSIFADADADADANKFQSESDGVTFYQTNFQIPP